MRRSIRTPYILLPSIPGINVVSAGDFAGEMGAIKNYANSRCITGRAGLYPSRYQSDEVARANGPLEPMNVLCPQGEKPRKSLALSRITNA